LTLNFQISIRRKTVASAITQPLKWFGGKNYLAKEIIALMPRHLHYVEPFFGGGVVLLARDPDDQRLWLPPHKGVSEVANDCYGLLINFWRVLQDEELFEQFVRRVQAIPLARPEWDRAYAMVRSSTFDPGGPPSLDLAVSFFVYARQSRAGEMKCFTPITRQRLRRGMNGNVSEWLGAVEGLATVHARLRRVLIECRDGIDLIVREDKPGTFFYCDPPYVHETRTTKNGYRHEMSDEDHIRLAEVLNQVQGKVILSGYHSELYHRLYQPPRWRYLEFPKKNNAAGGKTKAEEIEVLWLNYPPEDQALSH
jgi:DNA adenine methylase